MPFTDLPAVLKPEEVASYLQVRPETVYEDITAGRLNAIRIGNELRIRKEDLLSTSFAPDHVVTSAPGESLVVAQIERTPAFEWKWPSEKSLAKENKPEKFPEAYQTSVRLSDGRVFTHFNRHHGPPRRRQTGPREDPNHREWCAHRRVRR